MSEASRLRAESVDLLIELDGDDLLFRQQRICGTIDEGLSSRAAMKGIPMLDEASHSTVEIRQQDLASAPKPGESFRVMSGTGFGRLLRIKSVTRNGSTYRCECTNDQET